MQHRRILFDDDKGLAFDLLNETDSNNDIGIRVNAKYFMQIFDTFKGKSLQREQQINIEEAPQYFFSFDYKELGNEIN